MKRTWAQWFINRDLDIISRNELRATSEIWKKKKETVCLIIVSMSAVNTISCTLRYDFVKR